MRPVYILRRPRRDTVVFPNGHRCDNSLRERRDVSTSLMRPVCIARRALRGTVPFPNGRRCDNGLCGQRQAMNGVDRNA